MRGGVQLRFFPSTRGNNSRHTVHRPAILCTCNRDPGKRAGCVLLVRAETPYAMMRHRRHSRRSTSPRAFPARTAPIDGEGPRSSPGARGSRESSLFPPGYKPPKFRRSTGFQSENERRSVLWIGPYRVQLSGFAGPNSQAGKIVTQARKLITAVKFHLFNLRPHLISRIPGDDPLRPYSQVHGGQDICPRPVKRPPDIVAFQSGSIPDAAVRIIPASGLGNHALTSGCHLPILATMAQRGRVRLPDFRQVLKHRDAWKSIVGRGIGF